MSLPLPPTVIMARGAVGLRPRVAVGPVPTIPAALKGRDR